jgi:Lrp/AsnC family transcriptional regulator
MAIKDNPGAALRGCEDGPAFATMRNDVSSKYDLKEFCFVDKLDRKILDILQRDASVTAADIAERVGLSKAPCWRRIQKLQESGIVRRTVALLDARALNVGTTVFVTIKAPSHSAGWFEKFAKVVRDLPEVTELHRMSGDVDYLLRIVVPDIAGYDAVYKRLIAGVEMLDVSASFSLETLKSTTALPLNYAALD